MPELIPLTNDEPDVRFLVGDRVRIISTDRARSALSGFEVGQEVIITGTGASHDYEVVHPESGVGYCDAICLQHVPIRSGESDGHLARLYIPSFDVGHEFCVLERHQYSLRIAGFINGQIVRIGTENEGLERKIQHIIRETEDGNALSGWVSERYAVLVDESAARSMWRHRYLFLDEQEEQELEMPPYGVDSLGFVYRARPEHMKSRDSLTMQKGDKAILISERAGWFPLFGFKKGCLVHIEEVRPLYDRWHDRWPDRWHYRFPDYIILQLHPDDTVGDDTVGYAYEEELVSVSINYELKDKTFEQSRSGYYPSPEEIRRVIRGGF